jgi:hypothetical protein
VNSLFRRGRVRLAITGRAAMVQYKEIVEIGAEADKEELTRPWHDEE